MRHERHDDYLSKKSKDNLKRHDERVNKMKHRLFVFSIFIRHIKGIFMTLTLDQDTKRVMRFSSCLSLSSELFLSLLAEMFSSTIFIKRSLSERIVLSPRGRLCQFSCRLLSFSPSVDSRRRWFVVCVILAAA